MTYPIAQYPEASKTTIRASGFEQTFVLCSIQADWENAEFWKSGKYKILICEALIFP